MRNICINDLWFDKGSFTPFRMTKCFAIKVIPHARKNSVTEEDGRLKVHVAAPAVDGKANKAVLEILAKHFGVRKSAVRLLKGEKSREKAVEIILRQAQDE